MSKRVLVVEDERDLLALLEHNLQGAGHHPLCATSGMDALRLAVTEPLPDLIILDVMLPDLTGTEVCRRLKGAPITRDVPVLMLTARGTELDRVAGLEAGAEDYVVKPFSVRELMLRVRALLRRAGTPPGIEDEVIFGRLRLNRASHRVWVDESEIVLTALEFKLLETLLARRGRVQTRDTLLSDVWGIDADVTTRTVDTHVKRLRQKLGVAGAYVETLRGVGYRLCSHPGSQERLE